MRNWISRRCFRTGGNLRADPSRQRRGPLRRITSIITPQIDSFFSRPYVELECGHRVFSDGICKARCEECAGRE